MIYKRDLENDRRYIHSSGCARGYILRSYAREERSMKQKRNRDKDREAWEASKGIVTCVLEFEELD